MLWREEGGAASRVNELDTIFAAFTHAQPPAPAARGCYAVRARDCWWAAGEPSEEVCVPVTSGRSVGAAGAGG